MGTFGVRASMRNWSMPIGSASDCGRRGTCNGSRCRSRSLGTTSADGFLQRFLTSWLVVIAVGVPVGYLTGWLPPDRLVTFGFAVPIGAALGLAWLRRRLESRPWLARALVVVLAGWMIVGALLAWGRQKPFVSPREVRLAESAAISAGAYTPHGTPIVFLVDDEDATATFLASRAANIARAATSPERARDVYVFVGTATDYFDGRPTHRGDLQYDALSELTFSDIPDEGYPSVFAIAPFYRGPDAATHPRLFEVEPGLLASRNFPTADFGGAESSLAVGPSAPGEIATATLAILALLTVLGLGYALVSSDDLVTAIATAPAFGAAAITITAVALDRLGLRLADLPVAFAASVLAGLGGVALLVVKRKRDRRTPA